MVGNKLVIYIYISICIYTYIVVYEVIRYYQLHCTIKYERVQALL